MVRVKVILLSILVVLLLIQIFKKLTYQEKPITSNTVWTYWDSPFNKPSIVKKCIQNWGSIGNCKDVRVLNRWSVQDWIPREDLEHFSEITNNIANKTDLIRLYLLKTYGGIWMDASVFTNTKLSSWVPNDNTKVFCFKADRFSNENVTCLENFFIKAPKNDPFISEWLEKCIHDFSDKNYQENNKVYRKIIGKNGDYLVPYVSSMKIQLNKYPNVIVESAEKGPYKDTVENGWDANKICKNITYDQNLVKLYNHTRKQCNSDVVPITSSRENFLPKSVYTRFKDRFSFVENENNNVEVDMVYCICMPKRKEYAKKQLELLKTKYKMFNAITPKDLTSEDYSKMSQTYSPLNVFLYKQMTKLPVCLSFFMCYYDAYVNNYDTILVLEDDIKLKVSVDKIYGAIRDFKTTEFEIMFLGYCWAYCNMTYPSITEHLYKAPTETQLLCNHAMVMKKSFIKKYMERDEVTFWRHRNDHTLSDYLKNNKIEKCVTSPDYISQNREELGSNNGNNRSLPSACNLHSRLN